MALNTDQKAAILDKTSQGKSSTSMIRDFFEEPFNGRPIVLPTQVWNEAEDIPQTAPGGMVHDQIIGVVQRKIDVSLTAVLGTTASFQSDDLIDAIPFNFGDGSYNYALKDSLGNPIAFGQNDWRLDPNTGTITFYTGVPANMPPMVSFYKYVGEKGVGSGRGGGGSRLNLFTDPSFEQETDDEFTVTGTGTLQVIASELASPTNLFMLEADMDAGDEISKNFATGADYDDARGKFSAWIKTPQDLVVDIEVDGAPSESVTVIGTSDWQLVELPFVFGTTDIDLIISNANAALYYIDEMFIGAAVEFVSHNNLQGLQGGNLTERYHLTEDEHDSVQNLLAERHSNAILNDDSTPVHTIGGWVRYKNAGAVPTTGTGGTPDDEFNFSRDVDSPGPLSSGFSFAINKTNLFNAQGNGISLTKDVPLAMRGNFVKFKFAKSIVVGVNSGDFTLHVYDVTNAAMLHAIGPNEIKGTNGEDTLLVMIPANCTEVRFIQHCATDSTDLKAYRFVNVEMELADPVSIPLTMSQEIDLATHPLKGSFTGGKIRISKVGQSVTISQLSSITFASNANPSSAAGLIPEWARPDQNMFVTSFSTATTAVIAVRSTGILDFVFRVAGTSNPSARTSTDGHTISYNVPDATNTTQGLAVNANIGTTKATLSTSQSISTSESVINWNNVVHGISGLTYLNGVFTANRRMRLIINSQTSTPSNINNINRHHRLYVNNVEIFGVITVLNVQRTSLLCGVIELNKNDVFEIRNSLASSTVSLDGSTERNYITIQEVPFSNTALMAVPEAKMRVSGFAGYGSTNTFIGRYVNTDVNKPGHFFTYNQSATLGDNFTINVKGRYKVKVSSSQGAGANVGAGISVNATVLNNAVQNMTYAQGYRSSGFSFVASGSGNVVETSWEGVLDATDVVRSHTSYNTTQPSSTVTTYFEIEFLGYVS